MDPKPESNSKPKLMTRQRFIVIGLLFFHSVNTYMDRSCITTASDQIMKDLKITPEFWGIILGIFSIGYALFQVPAGWFADKFGPRKSLSIVVGVWSTFTALSGAAINGIQMLILRFLFGVGEAGAFPGAAQAFYRWLPVKERGIAHGINFAGSRIGGAISIVLCFILIDLIGWRWMFVVNGGIGLVWATIWLIWFRDNPRDKPKVNEAELEYIEKGRTCEFTATIKASFQQIFTSVNMFMAMTQYFASNVTFFITLSWLPKYFKDQWPENEYAKYFSCIPLVFAAFANWLAGSLVTHLYNKGHHVASRRIPAVVGFSLSIIGLILAIMTKQLPFLGTDQSQLIWFACSFGVAIFGVDMTLAPSWAFCNDIGGDKSGAVSGSMNMVGNIGGALSAIVFPLMLVNGSANNFFILAAILNVVAIFCWLNMNPNRKPNESLSEQQVKTRFISILVALVPITASAVGANMIINYKKAKEASKESETKQVETVDEAAGVVELPEGIKLEIEVETETGE